MMTRMKMWFLLSFIIKIYVIMVICGSDRYYMPSAFYSPFILFNYAQFTQRAITVIPTKSVTAA